MKIKNNEGRLVIENKGVGSIHEKKFFLDIEEAIKDGYQIARNTSRIDSTMRNFNGFMGRCVLYKDGVEFLEETPKVETPKVETPEVETPEVETPKVEDPKVEFSEEYLQGLTKKKELLAYAKSLSIEIDKSITAPMQIKKLIKESFNK